MREIRTIALSNPERPFGVADPDQMTYFIHLN